MSAVLPVNANCPRCGGQFRCGAAEQICACFALSVGPALRAQLAAQYRGCLCVACLSALQTNQQHEQKQEP
jgi:hypothetical protein